MKGENPQNQRLNNINKFMSVHVILGRKCTLAASRAAPWWVTLSMRRAPY